MAEQGREHEGKDKEATNDTGGKHASSDDSRAGGPWRGLGTDRAREVGLFRYALIRAAADPDLSPRQRGELVRELAGSEHVGPFGEKVQVSRETLDRWIRMWRAGGFDALLPVARTGKPRTPRRILEMGVALKREAPARTAAQCHAILVELLPGPVPSIRTLQRHFAVLELNTRPGGMPPKAFGRFQADARNDRWIGDALHGPMINGRKTYLFAFIDDYSRALTGYRWGHSEDTVRLEAALRAGIAARGIPKTIYVDNGSAYVSSQFNRALAVLGIRLIHSRPGQPAGRGKVERFFRTVREQFLVELSAPGALEAVGDLDQLNTLFTAWVETVYHRRIHSETGQEPLVRFLADSGPPAVPNSDQLVEAFLWSAMRTVTKTATVSLFSNTYEVDAALVGRKVELVFNPFDLTRLHVRFGGRDMGHAIPHKIGRHVHPDATIEPEPNTAAPTGINYLGMVAEKNRASQRRPGIKYNDLPPQVGTSPANDDPPPGPVQPADADLGEAGESA